jgi:hypothetical protein
MSNGHDFSLGERISALFKLCYVVTHRAKGPDAGSGSALSRSRFYRRRQQVGTPATQVWDQDQGQELVVSAFPACEFSMPWHTGGFGT